MSPRRRSDRITSAVGYGSFWIPTSLPPAVGSLVDDENHMPPNGRFAYKYVVQWQEWPDGCHSGRQYIAGRYGLLLSS